MGNKIMNTTIVFSMMWGYLFSLTEDSWFDKAGNVNEMLYDNGEPSFFLVMKEQVEPSFFEMAESRKRRGAVVYNKLKSTAEKTQQDLIRELEEMGAPVEYLEDWCTGCLGAGLPGSGCCGWH